MDKAPPEAKNTEVVLPGNIKAWLDELPGMPERYTPEWQAARDLDILAMRGKMTTEQQEAYQRLTEQKNNQALKDNLPAVIDAIEKGTLPQNLPINVEGQPLVGEEISPEVPSKLLKPIKEGNIDALFTASVLIRQAGIERAREAINELKAKVDSHNRGDELINAGKFYGEVRPRAHQEQSRAWDLSDRGLKASQALSSKFGIDPNITFKNWEAVINSPRRLASPVPPK